MICRRCGAPIELDPTLRHIRWVASDIASRIGAALCSMSDPDGGHHNSQVHAPNLSPDSVRAWLA